MIASPTASPLKFRPATDLALPPSLTARVVPASRHAFAEACAIARREGAEAAGILVLAERSDVLDVAVVLVPEEPLASARRAFLAAMMALADAVGAHGPPEMPLTFGWPDVLIFDGARLGGGRLGWPEACSEEVVPDWLVFSAMLILSKSGAGDPGLTPGSTALDEEGFPPDSRNALVESFARNLIRTFSLWEEDGFSGIAARYLSHLPTPAGMPVRIDRTGDVILGGETGEAGAGKAGAGETECWPLASLLRAPGWQDPATGTVRL
ncbi:biotin/lipoate--protein ligase family protein [Methylobacterium sp. Leaf117]|uniref:biotin/lipoate--protein ligase family protein n=1 Tax=Methylobacterium sp. Leaf117 TaxID=1736260 RepID=UPI0006F4F099|nr:biotin/lipoate--protein ligase family protein [Methylobacterium sp. Leaf117]KQP96614.1 hypothetical protein ASF57_02445 [Methylobacterium sp. Leaf117]